MRAWARERSLETDLKGRAEAALRTLDLGSFRRPVVRSGGAVRRTAALPPLAPFLAAEFQYRRIRRRKRQPWPQSWPSGAFPSGTSAMAEAPVVMAVAKPRCDIVVVRS